MKPGSLRNGLTLLLLIIGTAAAEQPASYDSGISQFIQEMSSKHGFDQTILKELMDNAKYRQKIIDAISRPAEGMAWKKYRPIFVTESRAKQGMEFWNNNEQLLNRAKEQYGVPPEIIVAIIGVETRYGRHAGTYPVLDALSTLAFGYPKRGDFFRSQLEEFLLLTREEEVDPVSAKGSYAGALGQPQFIPSSYRSYAVDFDNDGRRDLWHSNADVIGSVAAYFKRHHWQQNDPVTLQVNDVTKTHKHYIEAGMKPSIELGSLRASGLFIDQTLADNTLTSLIELESDGGNEYWLGLHNFYVITRYNHSNLYAMAVYQLSREIMAQYKAGKNQWQAEPGA